MYKMHVSASQNAKDLGIANLEAGTSLQLDTRQPLVMLLGHRRGRSARASENLYEIAMSIASGLRAVQQA